MMVLGVKISVLLLSIRAIMILDIVLSKVAYLSECVFWYVSRLCCCLYLCLNNGLVCISKNRRWEYWLVLLVCFSLFPILVGVCVCVVSLCKEGVCMLDWS